ncbi:MAG: hypothetical protein PHQ52_03070 [Candidatus Omnitrophica bacterium]|nr:hypothetical protein [Candidatus Omnitrophota bacterium]
MGIEKIIFRSDLHKKVIMFFHENPAAIDTLRGVSTWVRADEKLVKKVLSELAEAGILNSIQVSSTVGYSYTQDMQTIRTIDKALSNEKKSSF